MIARYDDWQKRLVRFLIENRQRAFRWGSWDCCLFATSCVREITGEDLAAEYRGQYKTMLGALRLSGGSVANVAEAVAKKYGIKKHKDIGDARPGDIILADIPSIGETLGIVSPIRMAVFSTQMGLTDYRFSVSKAAWRIG